MTQPAACSLTTATRGKKVRKLPPARSKWISPRHTEARACFTRHASKCDSNHRPPRSPPNPEPRTSYVPRRRGSASPKARGNLTHDSALLSLAPINSRSRTPPRYAHKRRSAKLQRRSAASASTRSRRGGPGLRQDTKRGAKKAAKKAKGPPAALHAEGLPSSGGLAWLCPRRYTAPRCIRSACTLRPRARCEGS
jgi:hypothetical protein